MQSLNKVGPGCLHLHQLPPGTLTASSKGNAEIFRKSEQSPNSIDVLPITTMVQDLNRKTGPQQYTWMCNVLSSPMGHSL